MASERTLRPRNAVRLVTAMCVAEVLTMMGTFAFPALLPDFVEQWSLSNTEAGWLNGVYFAGYTVGVPILASLTDRVDGRRVYLASAAVGALASAGFAGLVGGFWTALVFRTLGGLGLAGTFIPGLKALVDRLEGTAQARAVSFYTATFGLGTSLSFIAAGALGARFGWRWAFASAAAGGCLALVLAAVELPPAPRRTPVGPHARLLDFRPVFRNRAAMAYVLAYAAHTWELFAFRSWIVAFLAFCLEREPAGKTFLTPASVAGLTGLAAMWASIGGGELAFRFPRNRVLAVIMFGSALFASWIGFTSGLPYGVVATLCVLYALWVQGDSAALHMGTVLAAEPERRGTTLALQSLVGFGAASLGPLVVGVVLDLTGGGRTSGSWGAAFLSMGAVVATGPLFLAWLGRVPAGPTIEDASGPEA